MTDDFEQDVSRMLASRAAVIPEHYDVGPDLLARARRRRVAKLAGLFATVLVVATGTTAAVASVVRPDATERLATSVTTPPTAPIPTTATTTVTTTVTTAGSTIPTSVVPTTTASAPRVATVRCPLLDAISSQPQPPPPATDPRAPAVGGTAGLGALVSFAATTDPRFVVLGPKSWSCETSFDQDGRRSVVLYAPTSTNVVPQEDAAPVAIDVDWLWHGGIGSGTACSVFDDSVVVQFLTRVYPPGLPCPAAGRTVTRVDAHVATFVDTDGARGVGRMVLPSAQGADGEIVVLTCRPTTGLTTADCDTIVADYEARLRAAE